MGLVLFCFYVKGIDCRSEFSSTAGLNIFILFKGRSWRERSHVKDDEEMYLIFFVHMRISNGSKKITRNLRGGMNARSEGHVTSRHAFEKETQIGNDKKRPSKHCIVDRKLRERKEKNHYRTA